MRVPLRAAIVRSAASSGIAGSEIAARSGVCAQAAGIMAPDSGASAAPAARRAKSE